MASQAIYFWSSLVSWQSGRFQSRMKYSNAFEVLALATRGKFLTETMGITYKATTKNVLWRPASFGLSWTCSGTREDTLSWEYEDQRLLTTLFPVNKSHRQFYDSWKIDDPEPSWPWNRQLQNSCRPWWKKIHGIFIELMLLVNLYIFCNGMEWNLSPKIRKNSLFVIYFTIFSRVS